MRQIIFTVLASILIVTKAQANDKVTINNYGDAEITVNIYEENTPQVGLEITEYIEMDGLIDLLITIGGTMILILSLRVFIYLIGFFCDI